MMRRTPSLKLSPRLNRSVLTEDQRPPPALSSYIDAPMRRGYTATGYRSADVARRSGRALPVEATADAHLCKDRSLLGRMAQQFRRDNAIYDALITRVCAIALGPTGLRVRFSHPDPATNAKLQERFKRWSRRPEITGELSWRQCEKLALSEMLDRGDGFAYALDFARKVQYIESAQVQNGSITGAESQRGWSLIQGIARDELRRPRRYYVAPINSNGYIQSQSERPLDAADVVHWAYRKRLIQGRGEPAGSSTYSMLHRLMDVCDSEAQAWQIMTKFAVSITREGGPMLNFGESTAKADVEGDLDDDDDYELASRIVDVEGGMIFHGEPGDKIESIRRDIPQNNFDQSARAFMRIIGMPFGIPLEVLVLDFSKVNFSASKAARQQASHAGAEWRQELIEQHNEPITERWLRWEQESGEYEQDVVDTPFSWDATENTWTDQHEEALTWGERLDRGMGLHAQALRSVGIDRKEWISARVVEIQEAMDAARELSSVNEDLPAVDWRQLAGFRVGATEAAALAAQTEMQPGEDQIDPDEDTDAPTV